MTPAERKQKIRELHCRAADLYREAGDLRIECNHAVLVKEPDSSGHYGSAECEGCDQDFGWYCHASPDRRCHYWFQIEDGRKFVTLLDGTQHEVPADTEEPYYEDCIFCGHPDERK